MSENLIDYEYTQDNGVDSLRVVGDAVSQAKLNEFQDTLKDDVSRRGMFAFVTKLNALENLEAKASELRKKKGDALIIERPNVGGVVIDTGTTVDPEVSAHNEQIRNLKKAIDEFNASRAEFLKTFISKYISRSVAPAVTTRNETGGKKTRTRPDKDYFERMMDKPPEVLTASEQNEAEYQAFLQTPDAKKFDAMSEQELQVVISGFRNQGLGKFLTGYETMPDNEIAKRMMFQMKKGNIMGTLQGAARMIYNKLVKK